MKRVFAMIIALVMIAVLSVSVSAGIEPYGKTNDDGTREAVPVPKVTTAPAVDGAFDAVYNERSLVIPITRDGAGEGDRSEIGDVYGYAYMVFDDSNLYVYVDCIDANTWPILDYCAICPECGKQLGCPATGSSEGCTHSSEAQPSNVWDDDCVELLIDWTNSGDGAQTSQYRVSRANFCSRDYDTWNLGFSGSAKEYGGRWGAEFAIPLDTSREGTEIGINVMIHSQEGIAASPLGQYVETIAYAENSAEYGTAWEAAYFDYIVLGNVNSTGNYGTGTDAGDGGIKIDPPVVPGPGDPTPTPGPNPIPGPGPNPTPGPGLPGTADPIVSVTLVAAAALGAAIVVKKTCFKK